MIASLILVAMTLIRFGMICAKHGTKEEKENNGWTSFFALVILFTLYYYTGMFNWLNL